MKPLHPTDSRPDAPVELTPVEARSGVISGRVLLVLVCSFTGAVAALGGAWLILMQPN
jgi:hypothetical protein